MISLDTVKQLAQLARLKLSAGEEATLQKDMSSILEYVGQVSSAAQGEVAPPQPLRNVLRADTPREEGDMLLGKRDALLAALPRREGDYAVVRKILQKDE